NRPTEQSGSGVTLSITYDPAGRVKSASNGIAATTATYDPNGNITNKTLTRPGGEESFSYAYSPDRRMTSATGGSGTTAYDYDSSGRMISKTYPNGIETRYSFDGGGALSSLDVAKASVPVKTYQVARDARANVTSVTEDGTQTTTYTYDASSRLTGENNPWTGDVNYTYDPAGNRLTREKQGEPTLTYAYNTADQLTSDSGGNSYTYNTRGDLTKTENGTYSRDYAWDGKGRLTRVTDTDGNTTSYTYDPRDRTFASSENEQVQAHVYDMTSDMEIALLDGELNLMSLYHAGTDGLISSTTGDTTSYYSYNPHADFSLITDNTGNTTASLHYDAWGNTAEETDELYNYLGKHQRRDHRSTGLIKMGARFYNPETGRFISRDPLSGDDEIPITKNHYAYANDDPVNMVDLNGMAAMGEGNPQSACMVTGGGGLEVIGDVSSRIEDEKKGTIPGHSWAKYRSQRAFFVITTGIEAFLQVTFSYDFHNERSGNVFLRYIGCQVMQDAQHGFMPTWVSSMTMVYKRTHRIEKKITYSGLHALWGKPIIALPSGTAFDYPPYKKVPEGKQVAASWKIWKTLPEGLFTIGCQVDLNCEGPLHKKMSSTIGFYWRDWPLYKVERR
ncbi:MAG: hypothetical protein L6427_12830, partial [Actinomycetia bacterium]|nr:hypothetical protein [Actinomycetes bacterium]